MDYKSAALYVKKSTSTTATTTTITTTITTFGFRLIGLFFPEITPD